jgi:hypothetical protein
MGFLSGMATKMMCRTVQKNIPNASIEKLEEHFHNISKLLENSDDPDNDIMLVQLRIEITEEFDRGGHIPQL